MAERSWRKLIVSTGSAIWETCRYRCRSCASLDSPSRMRWRCSASSMEKAKGLSTSLLDYHAAQLAESLAQDRPELFIALQLNSIEESPWFRRLNLGGRTTSGLKRIASLRMMQQAVNKFLKATAILSTNSVDDAAGVVSRLLVSGRDSASGGMGGAPPAHADKGHRRVCVDENRSRYLY